MNQKVHTAVILAAGLGSRLKERTKEMPKAFIEVDGIALIHRSIQQLLKSGINKIIIGTGYLNHFFDDLKNSYPEIETCKNNDYESTGSMYTLYNLKHLLDTDFLLLEGDLLYEPLALETLIKDSDRNIILASGQTKSNDEVYIEANDKWHLVNMSKKIGELNHVSGELVGISKVSIDTFKSMCSYAQKQYDEDNKEIHYEDDFVGISKDIDILIKKVDGLAWCEIDDEDHLQRALTQVYPKIKERSSF